MVNSILVKLSSLLFDAVSSTKIPLKLPSYPHLVIGRNHLRFRFEFRVPIPIPIETPPPPSLQPFSPNRCSDTSWEIFGAETQFVFGRRSHPFWLGSFSSWALDSIEIRERERERKNAFGRRRGRGEMACRGDRWPPTQRLLHAPGSGI